MNRETAEGLLTALAEADNHVATRTGELKAAKQEYDAIADRLFALMDELGTESLRNASVGLQVSISETETDTIEDWDKLVKFALRHKALDLFQRRIVVASVKHWQEKVKGPVPGLGKFTKRRLHVTKFTK